MGLLANIKSEIQKMIRRVRTPKLGEGSKWFMQSGYAEDPISIGAYNGDNHIVASLNQFGNNYVAADGQMKKVMVARILNANRAQILGMEQFTAFEIPADVMPNDVNVLNSVLQGYLQQRSLLGERECIFAGNPYEMNTSEYMQDMQEYVDNNIGTQIGEYRQEITQKRQQEIERSNQERQIREADQMARNRWRIENQYARDNAVRQERINHPTLQKLESYRGNEGKNYVNYNGINVNSGDILKMRKVNKVGADKQGRYLYTAYLQNTFHADDVEILNANRNSSLFCYG